MDLPAVEIHSGDSIDVADERVERAVERVGVELASFERLNATLPTSDRCHFFQALRVAEEGAEDAPDPSPSGGEDEPTVVVVAVGEWDDEITLAVLNVLLELRLEPEPPGARVRFRFYSSDPVPGVLQLLFGDSGVSELECEACLLARFGHELEAASCQQLAAAGCFLARSCLDVELDLSRGEADAVEVVHDRLLAESLPSEPVNALILLGCIYGEGLRASVAVPSRWVRIRQFEPWPALLFSPNGRGSQGELSPSAGADADAASSAEGETGEVDPEVGDSAATSEPTSRPQVAFSPIAHVIHLYRTGDREALERASADLKSKCQ